MFLRSRILARSSRLFSTISFLNNQQSFDKLQSIIKKNIQPSRGNVIEESRFIESIQSILEFKTKDQTKVQNLIDDIVSSPNFRISEDSLRKILVLNPSIDNTINLISSYCTKNPDKIISKSIAMIPFRYALSQGDIDSALEIIQLTTGSDRYIQAKRTEQGFKLLKYLGGLGVSIGVVDVVLKSLSFQPMVGIYAMVVAYILNVSFFGSLSSSGEATGSAQFVEFIPGTAQLYRIYRSDELQMVSRVAEIDRLINGVDQDGFLSDSKLDNMIVQKDIKLVEQESETLMQEYWLSGGENFEWAEPEQDPAELLWKEKLDKIKPKKLNSDTKWTENLIESGKEESGAVLA